MNSTASSAQPWWIPTAVIIGCLVVTQAVPLAKTMDEQIHRLRHWAEGRARHASVPKQSGELQQRDF